MHLDRDKFFDSVGGAEVVEAMSDAERSAALDDYLLDLLNGPAYSEVLAQVVRTRSATPVTVRRGVGSIFGDGHTEVGALAPLPSRPTLLDFLRLRQSLPVVRHVLQSAADAMARGGSEELVLACLLHDFGIGIARVDHGWWGAQMMEPYVSERVAWAIRHHQPLRFFADESVGYDYPELYVRIFGKDFVPDAYITAAHDEARRHRWYMDARMVTVHDLYAFDPDQRVSFEPFVDIIGRHFRQPEDGLGFDGSPVAHMWRALMYPDHPL